MKKVTSDGRIVLWEGGSLWAFDVVSDPERRSNDLHAHHAFQLTLSAGGTAHIRSETAVFTDAAILIAPNVPHAIEPEGRIALIFVEPESREGAALRSLMGGERILGMDTDGMSKELLQQIWNEPAPHEPEVAEIGRAVLRAYIGEGEGAHSPDPRIGRVLDWIRTRGGDPISLSEASSVACLSESRFSHLFVAEVGLPLRTYLLWRRLMVAVSEISSGSSLTGAAHHAGFSDSAHFSRTFHRMFGLPAAALEFLRPV